METDRPAQVRRPRSWLLIVLGLAVVALVAQQMWPDTSATPSTPASNQRARQTARRQTDSDKIDPKDLKVKLERLEAQQPAAGESTRNPFRFQARAAAPLPPVASPESMPGPVEPRTPAAALQPQIPLKFMGIVEQAGIGQVALLTDCKGATFKGQQGQIIDGRYRLVKIGVESVVMEFPDGTGRTTIRISGECR